VTGLTNGTAYTFAIVATNAIGNSSPSTASSAVTPFFTCGTSTVADIDGNSYNTVLIGTQCWTASNLKVTKYNDGSLIPDLTTSTSNPWAPTSGARTGYDVSVVPLSDYVGTFGYLYNWYATIDSRKLCPAGWHVPTDAEWTNLIQFIDPSAIVTVGAQSSTAGTVMKSTATNSISGSGLGWNPGNPGTNTSGFSGLPGGTRNNFGSFSSIRGNTFFWSDTPDGSSAWTRDLSNGWAGVGRGGLNKSYGASVRCLRD
jgi:uncharacterized protein (TIGR02145 family)